MGTYLRPAALSEALSALSSSARPDGPRPVILAGGTDVYPARVGRPLDDDVLDITAIDALRGITSVGDGWRIGALATWTEVAEADLPPVFDGLRAAAATIGGRQIQNRGTIVGNVCNASPAADGVPNLIALDASVELSSERGTRRIGVVDFITGNRSTARAPDELVTAIVVPRQPETARSTFHKLGSRAYLVISIVMVAGTMSIEDGLIATARIAVGACSPVARPLPTLEAALIGMPAAPSLAGIVAPEHLAPLSPIDDVRGPADYRRDVALVLVRRAIGDLVAA